MCHASEVEPLRRKPPLDLTLVRSVNETVVKTPLASCTTNVSASRRVTTPLTVIFWPLVTVRALADVFVLVEVLLVCAKATTDSDKTSAQAHASRRSVLEL